MEIYNSYIRIPSLYDGNVYKSEICFVESFDDFEKNFLHRDERYVTFQDKYRKLTGYYQIDIPGIHFGKAKDDFLNTYKEYIMDVQTAQRHYAYIKILDDEMNPHINGQIMLFQYGRRIHDMVSGNPLAVFNKTFMFIENLSSQGFPSFDNCHFSVRNYSVKHKLLNIKDVKSLKSLDIIRGMERKYKLDKVVKSIKTKQNEEERTC